ncbi:CxC2 domain-containing protein [Mycena chlorophos]|uniref:CxC2 domain-containing protein n=1 Tax=Mycena chlorophos TaxID=658473 RepID=A0A8H6TQ81_MYCCL|nr:CxC2 domain-containing protein [Mycena chlorophos]
MYHEQRKENFESGFSVYHNDGWELREPAHPFENSHHYDDFVQDVAQAFHRNQHIVNQRLNGGSLPDVSDFHHNNRLVRTLNNRTNAELGRIDLYHHGLYARLMETLPLTENLCTLSLRLCALRDRRWGRDFEDPASTDNRRIHSETVVVQPPSPVKRARIRLNEIHHGSAIRQQAVDESQRYDADYGEDDVSVKNAKAAAEQRAMERLTRPAATCAQNAPLREPNIVVVPATVADFSARSAALQRISPTRFTSSRNGPVPTSNERRSAISASTSNSGIQSAKAALSPDLAAKTSWSWPAMAYTKCPSRFAGCQTDSEPNHIQLLKGGWYPSTTTDPRTCATLECLDTFEYLTLHGKTTPYDFYAALESLTDGTGIKPPDRYAVFLRISRQYSHLMLLKRGGRAYDRFGVLGTGPGDLALRCPACPRPGVNLPKDWEKAPPEDRCLYVVVLAIDACFRLKRRLISNEVRDPGLGTGWAYMVEWEPYRQFILLHKNQKEMSSCSGLRAVDYANTKFSRGYSVTGVGMGICARHEVVLPTSVGDLQAGERFCNMDYIVGSFLRHIHHLLFKILSYDIACQWTKNLASRVKKLPHLVRFKLVSALFQFAIPKLHIKGHLLLCQVLFALLLMLGAGMTDGEAIERSWSMIGGVATSTRVCGPGARWDKLDNHWSFWNWTKTLRMAAQLRRRRDNAIEQAARQQEAFEDFSLQQAEHVPRWMEMVREYEKQLETKNADEIEKMKNPYRPSIEGKSERDVRQMYQQEEAQQQELGAIPLVDVSPSEFVVLMLEVESEQRRIRALADLNKKSSSQMSLRKKRRALNARIRRLRTLQATYMPAALRILEQLDLPQTTHAERVPLLPPSALSATERANGGTKDGLVEIEQGFRDAQCRSALASLLVHLHVKARLALYKKQHARGQGMNTRSRTLLEQNERKILSCSDKYQSAWKALVAIAGGEDKVTWKKLKKDDIRCMAEPEDAAKKERVKRAAERARQQRKVQLVHAGIGLMPTTDDEMEESDDEDADAEREAQELFSGTRLERAREANALFKHGEGKHEVSWIWTMAALGGEGNEQMDEALRIEWAKTFARKRRWQEESRMSAEDLRRIPESFKYEERVWVKRGAGLDVEALGTELTEGMLAYAMKQAEMYRELARRAVATSTEEKPNPRRAGVRYRAEEWYGRMASDEGDGAIDSEAEDEFGNASDEAADDE